MRRWREHHEKNHHGHNGKAKANGLRGRVRETGQTGALVGVIYGLIELAKFLA